MRNDAVGSRLSPFRRYVLRRLGRLYLRLSVGIYRGRMRLGLAWGIMKRPPTPDNGNPIPIE